MYKAWLMRPNFVWSICSCGIPGSMEAVQEMMKQAYGTPERTIWQFMRGVCSLEFEL